MFDTIRSSYNLGEQFTNVELQTKDIEDYGIGGSMSQYWIDPSGYLWYPDYTGTNDFCVINEDDPRYNDKHKWSNFEWVPTGRNGKYRVHPITKYISAYPAQWDGDWTVLPTLRLHFKYGRLIEYEDITGRKYD